MLHHSTCHSIDWPTQKAGKLRKLSSVKFLFHFLTDIISHIFHRSCNTIGILTDNVHTNTSVSSSLRSMVGLEISFETETEIPVHACTDRSDWLEVEVINHVPAQLNNFKTTNKTSIIAYGKNISPCHVENTEENEMFGDGEWKSECSHAS